jgi:hypothetical protein
VQRSIMVSLDSVIFYRLRTFRTLDMLLVDLEYTVRCNI